MSSVTTADSLESPSLKKNMPISLLGQSSTEDYLKKKPEKTEHKKLIIKPKKIQEESVQQYAYTYQVRGKQYKVLADSINFTQEGIASWYGPRFHRKKTASGELFDMNSLTAAHKTLPLGSQVQVTNLANGKRVTVRINDRGPFYRNRIIDVSKKAAKELGFIRRGETKVKIKVIK